MCRGDRSSAPDGRNRPALRRRSWTPSSAACSALQYANWRASFAAYDRPDLILLDLGLPDLDGLDVIRRVREWSNVPVIVVTARGKEQDKVVALDAGADDYPKRKLTLKVVDATRHAGAYHAVDALAGGSFTPAAHRVSRAAFGGVNLSYPLSSR
jgi:DNA-binding response OmpR family regulator